MALSFNQLEQLAKNAGFSSALAPVMAAIALAESGGNPSATNPYDNNGTQTSWGLWQISYGNHNAPPSWSDPQANANLAYQKYVSQGLGAWGTYTSGKYKDFLSGMNTSALTTSTNPATQPAWLKDMVAWIQSGGTMQMWDKAAHNPGANAGPGEGGVDITAPPGTPVYALGTGPLLSASYFSDVGLNHPGAVLSQQVNVPGVGPENIYYQHIDLLPGFQKCLGGNCGNRIIQAGQQIGTVGSVGETEVGFNAGAAWGSLYGPSNPPGPWIDKPESWIAALMNQSGSPITDSTSTTGSGAPIIGPLIDWLQQTLGPTLDWFSNPTRIIKLVVGVLLVGVALFMLVAPEGEKVVKEVEPIAEAAAMA
jgi:murein DD-endopeptidase MepM/ murein hydrolase activator NlpD